MSCSQSVSSLPDSWEEESFLEATPGDLRVLGDGACVRFARPRAERSAMAEAPEGEPKTPAKQFPPSAKAESPAERRYWRSFRGAVLPQLAPATCVDYAASTGNLAVTAGSRVSIFTPGSDDPERHLTAFESIAHSAVFRPDGEALVAGSNSGSVLLFDTRSRSLLRQMEGHTRATRCARCSADKLHLLSSSDDATSRWWDVPTGQQLARLTGHTDYVRACAVSPLSDDSVATGSYDHTVRLWDTRTFAQTHRIHHGAPVESVCFLPGGTLLASAGGHQVCVWDIASGGRLLQCMRNHQKAVVCVRAHFDCGPPSLGEQCPRLITCSLDGHVKFHELDNFSVTHSSRFASAALCVAFPPNANRIAVGLGSGDVHVRTRDKRRRSYDAQAAETEAGLESTSLAALKRQGEPKGLLPTQIAQRRVRSKSAVAPELAKGQSERAAENDLKVASRRKQHLAAHDKQLKQFKHKEALDSAIAERTPEAVISVLEELAQRGSLNRSLAGRDADSLVPLLDFLHRHLVEPRCAKLLSSVAHRIVDIYGPSVGESVEVDALLRKLKDRAAQEVALQKELLQIQGLLEPLTSSAAITAA